MIRLEDSLTLKKSYIEDPSRVVELGFLVKGNTYRFWGLFSGDRHFFGVKNPSDFAPGGVPQTFYFLGADRYGQDILSRLIYGSRISLSVGLVSIAVTFFLGVTIGGISGYVGGGTDGFIQRCIEVINAFRRYPLWLAFWRRAATGMVAALHLFCHNGSIEPSRLDGIGAGGARQDSSLCARRTTRSPPGCSVPLIFGCCSATFYRDSRVTLLWF